jgi:hypothetical protein
MTYLNQYDVNEENVYISELISSIFLPENRHHYVHSIYDIMNISEQELSFTELENRTFVDMMYPGAFNFNFHEMEDPLEIALHESLESYKHAERKPITLNVEPILYIKTDKSVLACSICQDDFDDNNIVISLDCNHLFHEKCISEWGKYKPECPNCKTSIKIKEKEKEYEVN